jgi:hypothetical protein
MGKGLLGLGFGALTPVVVIGLNCIYGIVAAYWFKATMQNAPGMSARSSPRWAR